MNLLLVAIVIAAAPVGQPAEGDTAAAVVAAQQALAEQYVRQLDELARWCDEKSLTSEASQTREWPLPAELGRIVLPILADDARASDTAAKTTADGEVNAEWKRRFDELRSAQAAALFALAQRATAVGDVGLAYRLVVATLREDPNHADARRILGYRRSGERWETPLNAAKTRAGEVWHPRFGWLPAAYVERYEAGERNYRGRWIPAAEEQVLRQDPRRGGWNIETEHYVVKSFDSLESGVQLATELETLFGAWQQLFAGYQYDAATWRRRFERDSELAPGRRFKVVYFRNREQYLATLGKTEPRIGLSTGYYSPDRREAYFYHTPELDVPNVYHEATHQLFNESRPAARDVGSEANFWVVEGVACYMESLKAAQGVARLGGPDSVRLRDARRRYEEGFYVPIADLAAMSRADLQAEKRIAELYSEAAGMTHFLMHTEDGRYHGPLVEYLRAVYSNRADAKTLFELADRAPAELDMEYRAFISAGASEPAGVTAAR